MSTRVNVSLTDEFYAAIIQYADEHEIKSLSQVIVQFAMLGFKLTTGENISGMKTWGGTKSGKRETIDTDNNFKWFAEEDGRFKLKNTSTDDEWLFSRDTITELMDMPPAAMRELIALVVIINDADEEL